MKTKFVTLSMIALLATISISCSNNYDPIALIVPVVPVATNGFTWTQNGSPTELTVDNLYVNGQFKSILQ